MTTIYIVTFKESGERCLYSSLAAIAEAHTKEEVKISKSYILALNFKDNVYENRKVRIEKTFALSKSDVIKINSAKNS